MNLVGEMRAAANPGEAWPMGDAYFRAAEAEDYKHLNKEQLCRFLHSARALQMETGHICLYDDPQMPGDARVDIIHKPSYAVAAVAIYAYRNAPEIFDGELTGFFRNLLEGAFRHGIVGHGIEAEETQRCTLLMLCKAGLRDFLDANREAYPVFAGTIHRYMAHYIALAREIDEKQITVTANGFSSNSINHLIKELVAYWNGNTRRVFVYGTLMRGQRANYMLSGCEFGGRFQLRDYGMYHLGAYPGICPCPGESVLGELYFVTDEMVAEMDVYEREGSLYLRVPVQLHRGETQFSAEVYVYNRDITGCEIMRESWNANDEDLVWYAGYGSNLSQARFSCYISGGTCVENGRTYDGSSNHTPPRAIRTKRYPGKLYFGNSSPSWNGGGVAFFDPVPGNKNDLVYMKLYLITRQQFHDVMKQEGPSPNWYGRQVCLEMDDQGIPVYTLTSETHRPENTPSPAYVELIAAALKKEFNLGERQIADYLHLKETQPHG